MAILLLAASDWLYHLLPYIEPTLTQFMGVLGPLLGETSRLLGESYYLIPTYPLPLLG